MLKLFIVLKVIGNHPKPDFMLLPNDLREAQQMVSYYRPVMQSYRLILEETEHFEDCSVTTKRVINLNKIHFLD